MPAFLDESSIFRMPDLSSVAALNGPLIMQRSQNPTAGAKNVLLLKDIRQIDFH